MSAVASSKRGTFDRVVMSCLRRLIRCRYDVHLHGGDSLGDLEGPVVVLSNHPTYVDPAILLCSFPGGRELRPLVYTDTFRYLALRPLMTFFRALEVPEMRRDRRLARSRFLELKRDVVNGLHAGQEFLVYPSGRLQRRGIEWIGPARGTHDILSDAPASTQLVLVRSRGCWGSRFSCAGTGRVPNLTRALAASMACLALGGVFWVPKRRIDLTVKVLPLCDVRELTRPAFNAWLEAWYNADGGDTVRTVPYHWLQPRGRGRTYVAEAVSTEHDGSDASPTIRGSGWRARTALARRRLRSAAGRLGRRRKRSRSSIEEGSHDRP